MADIDLAALLAFHAGHGGLATMTVVRPELQFGVAELDGDGRVTGFHEKPRSRALGQRRLLRASSPAVLDYLAPTSVLEREPLERLAGRRPAARLPPRRASGTAWTPTRTRSLLNDLWAAGAAPWKLWRD